MGLAVLLVRFGWSVEMAPNIATPPLVVAWSTNLTPIVLFGANVSLTQQELRPFADVPQHHWAYKDIMNLKREGIIVGYPPEIRR